MQRGNPPVRILLRQHVSKYVPYALLAFIRYMCSPATFMSFPISLPPDVRVVSVCTSVYVCRAVKCSRWAELTESLQFHATVAEKLGEVLFLALSHGSELNCLTYGLNTHLCSHIDISNSTIPFFFTSNILSL